MSSFCVRYLIVRPFILISKSGCLRQTPIRFLAVRDNDPQENVEKRLQIMTIDIHYTFKYLNRYKFYSINPVFYSARSTVQFIY